MKVNMIAVVPTAALIAVLVSCGGDKESGGGGPPSTPPVTGNNPTEREAAETPWNSFSVASMSLLPKCETSKQGALAYVRGEKKFYTCDGTSWQAEDILPKDSFAVVDRWKFHVNTYQGEPNVVEEGYLLLVKIGDIDIVKYSNGTGYYSFSGYMADTAADSTPTNPADDVSYRENFSYSGLISDTSKEFQKILKLINYVDMNLRIRVNASGTVPTFLATVDVDGNFSNNTDKSFILVKD